MSTLARWRILPAGILIVLAAGVGQEVAADTPRAEGVAKVMAGDTL
ncbi:MAG: hypothetical protein H6Q32_878, partial [Bacteroidetes bacterium]|nr:hypothetical protein [Bacteroidota bacterium]